MQSRTRSLLPVLRTSVAAGVAGGVLIETYLIVTLVVIAHTVTLAGLLQFAAAGAIGPAAFRAGTNGALLGLVVHFAVSIAWGAGYAYLASTTPQVRSRPIVSGIAFGVIVMLAMQIVEVAAGLYRVPGPELWFNSLFAHTLFFGLPLAFVTARTLRP